ncbi:MAG: VWA-like domain-containing protein, partial [candidate division WOR-3 bacterium]
IMREIKEIIKRLELPENARVCGNLPDKSIRDPAKTKEIQKKIIELIHHAVIYAKGRGIFPAELERYVDELLQPKLDLAETLNLFAYRIGKGMEDYSFYRKNRRENELILPAAIGIERHIVIAIDTSGSIDDETLKIFLSEASALKDNKTKITFVTVDAKAYEPVEISEYDDFYDTIRDAHAIRGGGGTDFRDFFDFLKTLTTPVDGVIFFTDGDAEYPNKEDEPPYPVLWIITMRTNLNVPPFGETFYFDLRD